MPESRQLAHGQKVPIGWQLTEGRFQAHRESYVGKGIAVEGDERVRSFHVGAVQAFREDACHVRRALPSGFLGSEGNDLRGFQVADGGVVDLAGRQPGQVFHLMHADSCPGQSEIGGEDLGQHARLVPALDGDDQAVIRSGRGSHRTQVGQDPLHLAEVHAQPGDLDETAAAADHFVQAVRVPAGEVSGAKFVHLAPEREVLRALGVAQHDVRAGVDQFTIREAVHRLDPEGAARHRDADRLRLLSGQVRWQVGHAGGSLGGAVHDEEVPSAALADLRPGAHRCQSAGS